MMRRLSRQRGVALLVAVVLVAIATVLATAIAFSSAMSARRASTVFGADQSLLAAQGAEAMAAYLLTVGGGNRTEDALNQPWAQAYGPLQLLPGVTLEFAQIEDQQSKFNINNLVANGATNATAVAQFQKLLRELAIEEKWAWMIADWIDADDQPNFPDGAEDSVYLSQVPPFRPPNLPITSISELLALPGFGRDRYNRLLPYIAALPTGTSINTCTASGFVLDALTGASSSEYGNIPPQQLLARRQQEGCFPTQSAFQASIPNQGGNAGAAATAGNGVQTGQTSQYFRLRSVITIGTARFTLYSLMDRDLAGQLHVVLRTFGTE